MNRTINQLNQNITASNNFSIIVKYALDRRITETVVSDDTSFAYPFNNVPLNLQQLTNIYNTINYCN